MKNLFYMLKIIKLLCYSNYNDIVDIFCDDLYFIKNILYVIIYKNIYNTVLFTVVIFKVDTMHLKDRWVS